MGAKGLLKRKVLTKAHIKETSKVTNNKPFNVVSIPKFEEKKFFDRALSIAKKEHKGKIKIKHGKLNNYIIIEDKIK